MIDKRILVLAMLLVAFVSLGAVNASENITDDANVGSPNQIVEDLNGCLDDCENINLFVDEDNNELSSVNDGSDNLSRVWEEEGYEDWVFCKSYSTYNYDDNFTFTIKKSFDGEAYILKGTPNNYGGVEFHDNDQVYFTKITNGKSSKPTTISLADLGPGSYEFVVIRYDFSNYHPEWGDGYRYVMKTVTFSVMEKYVSPDEVVNNKKITLETGNVDGKCDENILFTVRAAEEGIYKSGLNITFSCNYEEHSAVTDSNGYATLKIHLKAGTYIITTRCGGVSKDNTINVNKVYVANKYKDAYVKTLNTYYKSNAKVSYGWKGNLEGYFRIYKGGKVIYQTKLNSNGYIDDYFNYETHNMQHSLSKMGVGTYSAVITDKNGKAIAKGTIKIVKSPTHIKCSSFVIKVGSKRSIAVYVYDNSNSRKGVAGAVQLKINGKTYGAKVKNGAAVVRNVKFPLNVKTYNGYVKFLENKNYKASSAKFKVSARKLTSRMYADSISTTTGAKNTLSVYVGIMDLDWNILNANSGTVRFTLNGETYYAKVKNGYAQVTVTAPYYAGTYTCKAVYLGSDSVKGSSASFSMVVKSPSPYKVITTTAKNDWTYAWSGEFKVSTKIWDMTAGYMAPYKYVDTTLYKNGKQITNTKYYVNYQIDGKWTGWKQYGIVSTAHHRLSVPDESYVGQIKVKFNKNVNPSY